MLLQIEGFERFLQLRRDAGHDAPGRFPTKTQLSHLDGLEPAQRAHDFIVMTHKASFPPGPRAHPVGRKTEPDVVDDTVRTVVIHGAHPKISFEFAEGILYLQEAFVMTQHFFLRAFSDGLIGVQEIPAITVFFFVDDGGPAGPLENQG